MKSAPCPNCQLETGAAGRCQHCGEDLVPEKPNLVISSIVLVCGAIVLLTLAYLIMEKLI